MRVELSHALLKTHLGGDIRLNVGQLLQGLVLNKRLGKIELQFGKAKIWAETPKELPVSVGSRIGLRVTSLDKGQIALQYVPAKAAIKSPPPSLSPLLPLLNGFLNGSPLEVAGDVFGDIASQLDDANKLAHNRTVQFFRNMWQLKPKAGETVSFSTVAGFSILLFEFADWKGVLLSPKSADQKIASLYLATNTDSNEAKFRSMQHRLRELLHNTAYSVQHIFLNGNPVGALNFEA